MLARRSLLAVPLAALAVRAMAAQSRTLRIGYQKGEPVLLAARQNRSFETSLAPLGVAVEWMEFPYGPPLLEAMRVDSIDFGAVGDTPPIFAQAARADLVYVAARPGDGSSMGIVVPPGSTLSSLGELKGKRVAFARGSSAQNLTIAALEKAGISYTDIQPAYLAPADAAAALANGAIDAWVIWDPYLAIAEARPGVRLLASGKQIAPQNSFYLARRDFATQHADIMGVTVGTLTAAGTWCELHRPEVTTLLSEATSIPVGPMRISVNRSEFRSIPISETVLDQQQAVADRFARLGLLPHPVNVRDFAWHASA